MAIRPVKTLAVDRSKLFLTHINNLLRKIGFTKIILSDNSVEALKLLKIWTPDIIFLEASMPGMNGTSALDHIKQDNHTSGIPVLLVLENHESDMIYDYRSLGADGMLTKPVDAVTLHESIQACLAAKGLNKRKCVRTPFKKKVAVSLNGTTDIKYATNLSEGGIYIGNNNPPPVSTDVEVTISSNDDSPIRLEGRVIYTKNHDGNMLSTPQGMAVSFRHRDPRETIALRDYISRLLSG